jgi:hypothetical protein
MFWERKPWVSDREDRWDECGGAGLRSWSRECGLLCFSEDLVSFGSLVRLVLEELAKNSTEICGSARGLPWHPEGVPGREAEDLGGILSRVGRERTSPVDTDTGSPTHLRIPPQEVGRGRLERARPQ